MDEYNEKDTILVELLNDEELNIKERLLVQVSFDNETWCWNWKGKKSDLNYGYISISDKIYYTHRVSYTIFKGIIPKGMVIDHLCHNRLCTNPEHLQAITQGENASRGGLGFSNINSIKTHCVNGHELTDDNLYLPELKRGRRQYIIYLKQHRKMKEFRDSITSEWESITPIIRSR